MMPSKKKAIPGPVLQNSVPTPEKEVFTVREAAEYLGVGRKQIDEAIRRRRLPVIQLTSSRRALRIYKGDLLKLRGPVA